MARVYTAEEVVGKTFGSLDILGLGEPYISPKGQTQNTVIVKCHCGRSENFTTRIGRLKSGATASCRMCGQERSAKAKVHDLSGRVFGKLTVLGTGDLYTNPCGTNTSRWWVRCSCGRLPDFQVRTALLNKGKTIGCRLCANEKLGLDKLHDLTGLTFGWLTVKSRAPSYVHPNQKDKHSKWWVVCKCGSPEFSVLGMNLQRGATTSCGCRVESAMASTLKNYFSKKYGAKLEYKIVKNPKTDSWLFYDIYLPLGLNPETSGIYIEVNGEQHYRYVSHWHYNLERFQRLLFTDKIKRKFAKKSGNYIEIDLRKGLTPEHWIQEIVGVIESYG